jgi:hypothetical protein
MHGHDGVWRGSIAASAYFSNQDRSTVISFFRRKSPPAVNCPSGRPAMAGTFTGGMPVGLNDPAEPGMG